VAVLETELSQMLQELQVANCDIARLREEMASLQENSRYIETQSSRDSEVWQVEKEGMQNKLRETEELLQAAQDSLVHDEDVMQQWEGKFVSAQRL
jgi:hypothetical protein